MNDTQAAPTPDKAPFRFGRLKNKSRNGNLGHRQIFPTSLFENQRQQFVRVHPETELLAITYIKDEAKIFYCWA